MTTHQMTIAILAAILAAGVIVTPAQGAASRSDARAYGKLCQNQSKKRVSGPTGTPFSRCVRAMGRLASGQTRSSRIACVTLTRKGAPGARRSPFDNCVAAGSRLIKNGNGIDRAYLDGMIVHHVSAVDMARVALTQAKTPYVQNLAQSIITSQKAEISRMKALVTRLRASAIKPVSLGLSEAEMGMGHDPSHLAGADPFDIAFVDMMIPHHQGAITMSKVVLAKGASTAVRQLAKQITAAQAREIEEMRQFRASAATGTSAAPATTPAPAGGTTTSGSTPAPGTTPPAPGTTPEPPSEGHPH